MCFLDCWNLSQRWVSIFLFMTLFSRTKKRNSSTKFILFFTEKEASEILSKGLFNKLLQCLLSQGDDQFLPAYLAGVFRSLLLNENLNQSTKNLIISFLLSHDKLFFLFFDFRWNRSKVYSARYLFAYCPINELTCRWCFIFLWNIFDSSLAWIPRYLALIIWKSCSYSKKGSLF
jgi:hypothetical protein